MYAFGEKFPAPFFEQVIPQFFLCRKISQNQRLYARPNPHLIDEVDSLLIGTLYFVQGLGTA